MSEPGSGGNGLRGNQAYRRLQAVTDEYFRTAGRPRASIVPLIGHSFTPTPRRGRRETVNTLRCRIEVGGTEKPRIMNDIGLDIEQGVLNNDNDKLKIEVLVKLETGATREQLIRITAATLRPW